MRTAGVRLETDKRDNYTPGWKFNHWEMKGIPIRLEMGPKDLENGAVVLVRRDKSGPAAKESVKWDDVVDRVQAKLEEMQAELYSTAKVEFEARKKQVWSSVWLELECREDAGSPAAAKGAVVCKA